MSVFFHIDIDAFYANVEQMDRPELAGKPIIVGARPGHRGVVSTCNYLAREYGVYSSMPVSEAYRLCPKGEFLPVRMERYAEISRKVMSLFEQFTPDRIQVSIDESSLDMSGTERLWGKPLDAAKAIKNTIMEETGLTISIGVAPNRYLAKIASGLNKPDGLTPVPEGEETDFMAGLPLEKLWGAGNKTRERLIELGIGSIRRLQETPMPILKNVFGNASASFLYNACRGIDPGIYSVEVKSRSISTENTFERDINDRESIEAVLLDMAEELSYRMYNENLFSRTLVLKLRYSNFETVSVRESRDSSFTGSSSIYEAALSLLEKKWNGKALRLIGLGLASISGSNSQGELFEDKNEKQARIEKAVFSAKKRGLGNITRARLINKELPE